MKKNLTNKWVLLTCGCISIYLCCILCSCCGWWLWFFTSSDYGTGWCSLGVGEKTNRLYADAAIELQEGQVSNNLLFYPYEMSTDYKKLISLYTNSIYYQDFIYNTDDYLLIKYYTGGSSGNINTHLFKTSPTVSDKDLFAGNSILNRSGTYICNISAYKEELSGFTVTRNDYGCEGYQFDSRSEQVTLSMPAVD